MDQELSAVQRETLQAQAVMRDAHFRPTDVALVILTSLAVLYTLYFAASIILPFVLALVLSLLLGPAARFLCDRLRLPRMLAALILIAALFTAIGYWFGSHAASNRTPNRKKFLAPYLRKKTFLPS